MSLRDRACIITSIKSVGFRAKLFTGIPRRDCGLNHGANLFFATLIRPKSVHHAIGILFISIQVKAREIVHALSLRSKSLRFRAKQRLSESIHSCGRGGHDTGSPSASAGW